MAADTITLYISAADDLAYERDILGRSISEIPVPMGWDLHQSPRKNDRLDHVAVASAAVHYLLLGGDIRAPIGLEWHLARRSGRRPVLFLKSGIHRTMAANEFTSYTSQFDTWTTFISREELRAKVLTHLVEHITQRAVEYELSPSQVGVLTSWLVEYLGDQEGSEAAVLGGAGESGRIYSTERYNPSGGVLLDTSPAPEGPDP